MLMAFVNVITGTSVMEGHRQLLGAITSTGQNTTVMELTGTSQIILEWARLANANNTANNSQVTEEWHAGSIRRMGLMALHEPRH